MTDLLVGIDVGSNSSKGVLCRPDGAIVGQAVLEHTVDVPRPGWAEMDADGVWWSSLVDLCQTLVGHVPAGDRIAGLAVSAMGPCVLPVDADGRPLRPAILYGIDTRATPQIASLEARYGRQALFELSGNRLTTQSVGPKILWLRENEPEVYARARWFLTASSYLVMRLTGEHVVDRHAASHCNPLVDIEHMTWSDRFADAIVEPSRLPAIRACEEIAGPLTSAAAAETGIPAGTPVTVGNVDTMSEALSVGVVQPGDLMLMYGSTAFLLLVLERRHSHPDLWTTAGCFGERYGISGGLATSGAVTTWFRNTLSRDLETAEAAGGPNAYAALADEARGSPPGSRGLITLPYFSGERTPLNDPAARGMLAGLSLAHTRGDLFRSVLEGTAFAIRHNLEIMGDTGSPIRRATAVGGGAHDSLWLQIVSDVTGLTQRIPARTTGASIGDAFLAGLATGVIDDPRALEASWVQIASRVEPDPGLANTYDELYGIFRTLYPQTRGTAHQLAGLPTTEPPGHTP